MESQKQTNCVILLIGFNRPELIQKRLLEIGEKPMMDVLVSIDGGISESSKTLYRKMENNADRGFVTFTYHEFNQGLVSHITKAISNVLETYQYAIIIEDDVKISRNFIAAMAENLLQPSDPQIATWGGFSPLTAGKFLGSYNRWRRTVYFSAWGWGVSRDIWQKYNPRLPSNEFEADLKESNTWARLTPFQKSVWKSRFRKVFNDSSFTWDYQMQYMSFKYDLIHILPVFRLTDNEGFNDSRSTNTKSRRPTWMKKIAISNDKPRQKILPTTVSNFFVVLDSLTFSGDSKYIKLLSRIRAKIKFKTKRYDFCDENFNL